MRKSGALRIGIVLLLASVAAGVFALVGRADDPRFNQVQASLAPSFVNAGSNVLYTAHWHYIDSRTLTHASVTMTVPAGWTLVPPSKPAGCTQNGTAISCDWGTIRPGAVIEQQVELTTDSDLGSQMVNSQLNFYEGPGNPGRVQFVAQDPATTNVISADQTQEPDRAGACVSHNGGSISTLANHGGSSTTEVVPGTTALCSPTTIEERARTNPDEACFTGLQCLTDIVTTNAPEFAPGHPIQLTIVFYGTGLNNTELIFNGGQPDETIVETCDQAVPPDPCYTGHRARQQSVTWSVNWSGRDPGWAGGG